MSFKVVYKYEDIPVVLFLVSACTHANVRAWERYVLEAAELLMVQS